MNHLTVLMAMFPNQVFLSVDDIAKIMAVSKGHIYNLSSREKLPFKVSSLSDKIQVSIVEMAKFLDRQIDEEVQEKIREEEKKHEVPISSLIKKKVGRPRNSSRITASFQSQLRMAIVEYEVREVFELMTQNIDSIQYSDSGSCQEKFESLKSSALDEINQSQVRLNHSFMALNVPAVQDGFQSQVKPSRKTKI